jgi:hypothetical protein
LAQRLLVGQDPFLQLDPACLNQKETQVHDSFQTEHYQSGSGGHQGKHGDLP